MNKGSVVLSLKGKEKAKYYAVLDFDEKFCYLANGRDRKIEKPKKKNLAHVRMTDTVLNEQSMSTDRKLCESLKRFGMNDEVKNNV